MRGGRGGRRLKPPGQRCQLRRGHPSPGRVPPLPSPTPGGVAGRQRIPETHETQTVVRRGRITPLCGAPMGAHMGQMPSFTDRSVRYSRRWLDTSEPLKVEVSRPFHKCTRPTTQRSRSPPKGYWRVDACGNCRPIPRSQSKELRELPIAT